MHGMTLLTQEWRYSVWFPNKASRARTPIWVTVRMHNVIDKQTQRRKCAIRTNYHSLPVSLSTHRVRRPTPAHILPLNSLLKVNFSLHTLKCSPMGDVVFLWIYHQKVPSDNILLIWSVGFCRGNTLEVQNALQDKCVTDQNTYFRYLRNVTMTVQIKGESCYHV